MVLSNLGVAYANVCELRQAAECYEQALAVVHDVGDRRDEGSVLGNLASPGRHPTYNRDIPTAIHYRP